MHNLLEALVTALGWALLNFIWQGVLIGCSVALAMQLLRRARPQIRYAVACGAMLLCLILPLTSVISSLQNGGLKRDQSSSASAQLLGSLASNFYASISGQAGDAAANTSTGTSTNKNANTRSSADPSPAVWDTLQRLVSAVQDDSERVLRQQLPWIVGLWLAGGVLMSLRLMLGLQWVAAHTRRSAYTINHYWQRRMAMLASRCDMRRDVRLGVAEGIDSPITAGCWRPIILVPASLISGMPPDLLEALLAHELAHIRRHDYLVNLLQSAIEILLFYHPSVWALSRRIRIEREQIADDLAVDMLGQPQ
ncbi:M56 family metallopeptidase [Duganella fentianensis]|uniref:M56 family metallopeptidase n=1 Tax=Duganella fentianensis TaxID=2692177 RepID=UPI001E556822|nr:M56 family metallopeptidase [Duganella fentianensis]